MENAINTNKSRRSPDENRLREENGNINNIKTTSTFSTIARVAFITLLGVFAYFIATQILTPGQEATKEKYPTSTPSIKQECPQCMTNGYPMNVKAIPSFRSRYEIPFILDKEKLKRGVELGVQAGNYAGYILGIWKSCEEYWLVDLWKKQENYIDEANVGNKQQEELYKTALTNTKAWPFVKVCRDYTTNCAKRFPDEYFDWIYVDARHDRKGCYEDLVNWWPKLRKGGLIMGHDYVIQSELQAFQNWTVNFDGTIDTTGEITKGAVDEFFMSGSPETNPHYRQVIVSYREPHWNTWAVRK